MTVIKAKVKVTGFLTNPEGKVETLVPVEYPDASYARAAVVRILLATKQVGFMDELSPTHVRWVPADSPRVLHIEAELQTVAIADNLDMAAAVAASKTVPPAPPADRTLLKGF